MKKDYHLVVAGGGAAGFFAAINYAAKNKGSRVLILEKSPNVLGKVKVSGGGRCNVTHACIDAKTLTEYYPRGKRELLSVFYQFNTTHTIQWFKQQGISLKKEADGRMFPITDNSQTIIDCFLQAAHQLQITVQVSEGLSDIKKENDLWQIYTSSKRIYTTENLLIATGSSEKFWNLLKELDHTIIEPVPSLFTFNIKDSLLQNLQGISVPNATVKHLKTITQGPLLITHWGLSGPAVLKLSAWAARELYSVNYHFTVQINFNSNYDYEKVLQLFTQQQSINSKQKVINFHFSEIPARLWHSMVTHIGIEHKNWADVSKKEMQALAMQITQATFQVNGKSTFKEEFVTAGGISLKEVDFKTMQSKIHSQLYFAGEVLDIDAVTGGFNFQAAWSTAWLAAQSMSFAQ